MASLSGLKMRLRTTLLRQSPLDVVIPPEVINDGFSDVIRQLAGRKDVRTVLEIGSSSGEGSTASLVQALQRKSDPSLHCLELSRPRFDLLRCRYAAIPWVYCYNLPSIPVSAMPTEADVVAFFDAHPEFLGGHKISKILGWLEADLEYMRRLGDSKDGITAARQAAGIDDFDLVLIDGSVFAGEAELNVVYGARYVLIDDIATEKNYANYQRLTADPAYSLVVEDWDCRNGYAAFRRGAA